MKRILRGSSFIVALIAAQALSPQAGAATCADSLAEEIEAGTLRLEKTYSKLDSDFEEIPEIQRPVFEKGRKKSAVLLVHGFMGSPEEMSGIADRLTAEGYPIYNTLIPGFGGTPDIANQYTHKIWTRWFSKQVTALKNCYQKIHLVGFSTGGLLIYDYLRKNPDDTGVASASLVSPFFKSHGVFSRLIQTWAELFLNTISVNTVYYGLKFPDVQVMIEKPESYLQEVPIQTSGEIVELGELARTRKIRGGVIATPVLMFLSPDDQVIDQTAASDLIENSFSDWTIQTFRSKQRAPHHLMVREVSPVAQKLQNQIVDFVSNR